MVGDSLRNDVDGPVAAGLRGIWLNRTGESRPADRGDIVEIAYLHALPAALAATNESGPPEGGPLSDAMLPDVSARSGQAPDGAACADDDEARQRGRDQQRQA